MSSPTPDDYASLAAPWQPIAKLALEKVVSLHTRVSFDHGTKVNNMLSVEQHQAQAQANAI